MMVKFACEVDHMNIRMQALEKDNTKNKWTFDGVTRSDVDNMLKYKVERSENDRKIKEIENSIDHLNNIVRLTY